MGLFPPRELSSLDQFCSGFFESQCSLEKQDTFPPGGIIKKVVVIKICDVFSYNCFGPLVARWWMY